MNKPIQIINILFPLPVQKVLNQQILVEKNVL